MGTIVVPIFLLIAAIYFSIALRDRIRKGPSSNPARKAWLRTATILALVALMLLLWQSYLMN